MDCDRCVYTSSLDAGTSLPVTLIAPHSSALYEARTHSGVKASSLSGCLKVFGIAPVTVTCISPDSQRTAEPAKVCFATRYPKHNHARCYRHVIRVRERTNPGRVGSIVETGSGAHADKDIPRGPGETPLR